MSSIREALPYLIKTVEDTFHRLGNGQAGKFYREISLYLDELEPLAISTILLKITFDRVFSTKRQTNLIVPTMTALGSALESECKFVGIRSIIRIDELHQHRYFHESCGTMQKQVIASKKFGEHDIRWKAWSTKTKVSLGRWG